MQIRTQSSGGRCRASGFDSSVRVDSTTFRRLRVKLRGRGGDTPAATFVWIRTGCVQAQAQSHGRASLSGRRRSERQMFRTTATTGAFFLFILSYSTSNSNHQFDALYQSSDCSARYQTGVSAQHSTWGINQGVGRPVWAFFLTKKRTGTRRLRQPCLG